MHARDLAVTLQPYHVCVAHARTNEVYLEGQLERGIVPQESVWMQGDGTGEDGFLMLLRKMNLELLCRSVNPSRCGIYHDLHMYVRVA